METTTITIYKASQGHWLYKDEVSESGRVIRSFAPQVVNADDSWHECTDAEKEEWEEAWRKETEELVAAEEERARKIRNSQAEETTAEEVTDEY